MFKPLEVYIGLRYTRAKRRNHFISFISMSSILGVAVGVMALITVLSVMNGFKKELTARILGMTAHAVVVERSGRLEKWPDFLAALVHQPRVLGAAPFIRKEAMLTHRGLVQGALIRGILPSQEVNVSMVGERIIEGDFNSLTPGAYKVVVGRELAHSLGVRLGDRITVVAPQPSVSAAGIMPRLKRFTVSAIFEIGMHEYDASLALVHMEDAARLFRLDEDVSGIRLQLDDVYAAPAISRQIVAELRQQDFSGDYAVVDWTQYHVNFFRALKTEKVVMFVILALIVAVAAFNIVSTLVMVVTDKQSDVAVLRTLGMKPSSVMAIFVVQGTVIGLLGTLIGVVGGVWLASNVETIVPAVEEFFRVQFLPADVYYISDLPSDLRWSDVVNISIVAFVLCLLATLYPAWQAAQSQPAEALRYE